MTQPGQPDSPQPVIRCREEATDPQTLQDMVTAMVRHLQRSRFTVPEMWIIYDREVAQTHETISRLLQRRPGVNAGILAARSMLPLGGPGLDFTNPGGIIVNWARNVALASPDNTDVGYMRQFLHQEGVAAVGFTSRMHETSDRELTRRAARGEIHLSQINDSRVRSVYMAGCVDVHRRPYLVTATGMRTPQPFEAVEFGGDAFDGMLAVSDIITETAPNELAAFNARYPRSSDLL